MIFGEGVLGLVMLGLWIFCIIDVITTDESHVRNLPKIVWLIIVILIPDVGSIAWLIAGRNWAGAATRNAPRGTATRHPEYDRPGRSVPTNPDDDEEFLRGLRDRADEQRRNYQERRNTELAAEEERLKKPPTEED